MHIAGLERESFELAHASGYIPRVLRESRRHVLSDRASAHDAFRETVFKSVQVLAGLLGVEIGYESVANTETSGALIVNGPAAVLFEHVSPKLASVVFLEAIELGRQESELDFRSATTGTPTIVSKVRNVFVLPRKLLNSDLSK